MAMGVVLDGIPPRLNVSMEDLQRELNKRAPGRLLGLTSRFEEDKAEILSGTFCGKTLGTPICVLVWNKIIALKIMTILTIRKTFDLVTLINYIIKVWN